MADADDIALEERVRARIRQRMVEKGWHNARMAKQLDEIPSTLYRLMAQSRHKFPLTVAVKAKRILGYSWAEMFELDPDARYYDDSCTEHLKHRRTKETKKPDHPTPSLASLVSADQERPAAGERTEPGAQIRATQAHSRASAKRKR